MELENQNKNLLIRNFFSKWIKETKYESNTISDTKSIKIIILKYIIRYLIMYAKILKFKKILIKYVLNSKKK